MRQDGSVAGMRDECRHVARSLLAGAIRRTPKFRGLGRCVLAMDGWLTCPNDPGCYETEAVVNGDCRLLLDLRNWEQKFAFYYGTLEAELIAAVKQHFTGGIFYDIGASIGLYSVAFGRLCRQRGGYVRAIEPMPANRQRLAEQLARNGLDASLVRIEQLALGEKDTIASMKLVDAGKPGNAKIAADGDVSVKVTTLDSLWHRCECEPISFIKIDTEGWDAKIIDGGREAIATCRPNMLVEFNRERMRNNGIPLEPCWQFLVNELHYSVWRLDRRGNMIAVSRPQEHENLLFLCPKVAGVE
jgi:FkbM family methyltransferase